MPLTFTDQSGLWTQIECSSGKGMCWQSDSKSDTTTSLAKLLNVPAKNLNTFLQNPTTHIGDKFDASGYYLNNNTTIRANVVQVFLVSEPPSTRDKVVNFFSREESMFRGARVDAAMQELFDFRKCHCQVGIIYPFGLPSGLRMASPALSELFAGGSVRNMPIINIRSTLLERGFTQTSSFRGAGYLFRNAAGEEVRIMNRAGGWDIRVRNASGNYLDEFGNVASPAATHGINVRIR